MPKTSPKILKERNSRGRRKFFFILGTGLLLIVLLHVSGVYAKAPEILRALAQRFNLPVTKQGAKLPVDIQKAIVTEAERELTEGANPEHFDIKSEVDFEDIQAAKASTLPDNPLYIFKRFGRGLSEFLTFDPLAKTHLVLKNNSLETVETLALLQKSLNEKNSVIKNLQIGIVAREIGRIENKFNQILNISNGLAKTDRNKARAVQGIAFNYAEKYFRSELILKILEDKLDDAGMARIEMARLKGLGALGNILVSYHPDPQVLSRELARALVKVVGSNYTELKTAEILQEIEDANTNETQKTSLRLAQYLLIEKFEKKVLAMPSSNKEKLLDGFISQLSGSPMQEFKTLTRIRRVFKSKHLIVWTEVYKAKVLEKFEGRVLGLSTISLQNQFVNSWVNDPADLRILEALELRAQGSKNIDSKLSETIKNIKDLGYKQIADIYNNDPNKINDSLFYKSATAYPDVLDIKVALSLGKAFNNGSFIKELEKQIVKKFTDNLPESLSGISVNPLPETTNLFSEIKAEIPLSLQNEVEAAINAEIRLDSIEVPQTNTQVENLVNQLENSQEIATETQILYVPLEEVISQIESVSSEATQQEVIEQAQEIAEEIFSAPAGVVSPVEENLPSNIQQEIEQLQETTNTTPQVDPGVVETVVNTVQQTVQSAPTPTPVPEVISTPANVPAPAPVETPPPATVSVPSL